MVVGPNCGKTRKITEITILPALSVIDNFFPGQYIVRTFGMGGWKCSRICGQQMCIDSFMINGSAENKFNLWLCMPLVSSELLFLPLGKNEKKSGY